MAKDEWFFMEFDPTVDIVDGGTRSGKTENMRKSVEKMRAQREQRLDDNITDYYKVLAIKMAQNKSDARIVHKLTEWWAHRDPTNIISI